MTYWRTALDIVEVVDRSYEVETWKRLFRSFEPDADQDLQQMMTRILNSDFFCEVLHRFRHSRSCMRRVYRKGEADRRQCVGPRNENLDTNVTDILIPCTSCHRLHPSDPHSYFCKKGSCSNMYWRVLTRRHKKKRRQGQSQQEVQRWQRKAMSKQRRKGNCCVGQTWFVDMSKRWYPRGKACHFFVEQSMFTPLQDLRDISGRLE